MRNRPKWLHFSPYHILVLFSINVGFGHFDEIYELNRLGKYYKPVAVIHFAAAYGDAEEIYRLVEIGADVNARDWVGQTPLLMAAKFARVSTLKALLELGADPTMTNYEYNETPLHIFSKIPFIEAYELLVNYGASVNAKADIGDFSGGLPIHFAAAVANSITAVRWLLDHGSAINEPDLYGNTPIFYAVKHENLDMIKLLLSRGANVSAKDQNGNTILHIAVIKRQPSSLVIEYLLFYAGLNINVKNHAEVTPLHLAIKRGHTHLVALMLGEGADVNIRDGYNRSCIDIAKASWVNPENIKCIIDMIKETQKNMIFRRKPGKPDNIPLIHMAAGHGDIRLLTMLLYENRGNSANYINFETVDEFNQTALHTAAKFNQFEACQVLLSYGANPNILTGMYGLSPFHYSARTGSSELIELFIVEGAHIADRKTLGTALLQAVQNANAFIPAIRSLLRDRYYAFCDECREAAEALRQAVGKQNIKLVEVLMEHGARLNPAGNSDSAVFFEPMVSPEVYPQIPVIGWLVNNGADINIRNRQGRTPLHEAIRSRRRKEVIEYLLFRGADPNAVDSHQCDAPLYLAVRMASHGLDRGPINFMPSNETVHIARLLIDYGSKVNAFDRCSDKTALQQLESTGISDNRNPGLRKLLKMV